MVTINLKWVAVGLLALTILAWHYVDKRDAIQKVHADYALKSYKNAENVNKITIDLLNSSMDSLQKKEDEIERINGLYDDLAERMRKRPPRSSAPAAKTPSTCTGAELYREDGLFLAGEAARAEKIIKERDYYYDEYERARAALDSAQRENARQHQ